MATKNFAQMTTKKLNALLATASDEDKAAIEAVLEAREQAQAPAAIEEAPAEAAEETPLLTRRKQLLRQQKQTAVSILCTTETLVRRSRR